MPRISPAHLEAIIEIAADAIVATDERQRIVLFNRGAEFTFGYTADEVLGKQLDILLPEAARAKHQGHVEHFGAAGPGARLARERSTVEGRRKNGEIFPAEVSLSYTTVGGRSIFTGVLRDISERRQAEEERLALLAREHAARESAERATRLRDDVLGIVSHDLRNPVSTIAMAIASLESDPEPAPQRRRELVAIARDSLEWMNRLIQDLLDVANIDAGRLSVDRSPSDLVIVLVRAYMLFQQRCLDAGIQLSLDVAEQLPRVYMDGERLLQVLGNLLSNAVKFTPDGGHITISARTQEDDGTILVAVADTGPGIPPEAVPHIFERFWQMQRSARTRGTGLGLSIASGIVAAHDGKMWVDTTVGSGSTFYFTLPLAARVTIRASSNGHSVPAAMTRPAADTKTSVT